MNREQILSKLSEDEFWCADTPDVLVESVEKIVDHGATYEEAIGIVSSLMSALQAEYGE